MMDFTYDVTTERGQVRLMVADTDSANALLQDAEIDFFITAEANIYFAAAQAAGAIAAIFARKATSKDVGDLSIDYSSKANDYKQLKADLMARGKAKPSTAIVTPKYGGTSISTKDANYDNTDLVMPRFTRDKFVYPGTGSNNECDKNC